MNTTSASGSDAIDLTGVTLTITLSEYEKLREMKKTNDTLLQELENMTKAYNKAREDLEFESKVYLKELRQNGELKNTIVHIQSIIESQFKKW